MTDYCFPKRPTIYWINVLNYKCQNCRKAFQIRISNGDDIVKFKSQLTSQIKWLPVDGKGGYNDLFKKLSPDYKKGEPYLKVIQEFTARLNNYIEKDNTADYFEESYYKHECIYCKSKEITLISEEVLVNPDLDWLKISCELMQE